MTMFAFLGTLWFVRTAKAVLFWIYLWQLKEYHIGRFLDHFRTEKGRKIFLNLDFGMKIFLIVLFFRLPLLVFFLTLIFYILESLKTIINVLSRKIKRPVLTSKTALLIAAGLLMEAALVFLVSRLTDDIMVAAFYYLIFDILTPLLISIVVLLFQPLAVWQRNKIIARATAKRGKFKDLTVIGITGSYGKTSTKEFLYAILSEKFRVLATKEHQNSEVGVSQCILNELSPEHQIFIVEMGAYGVGGIKLLCNIARPKIGILTGINEQHLATFGSLENIIKTKYELIESLPPDGLAFFNAKNKYCLELYKQTGIKKFLYGENIEQPGLENIEGAKAVARQLGMNEEEISRAVSKIENKFAGIRITEGINGTKIINATYSANPDSVIAHLDYVRSQPGQKIIIMPCLIELGRSSKEIHRNIGRKIGQVCDLVIITTKDRFEEMREGFIQGGGKEENILFIENPKKIYEKIKSFVKAGDIIILENRVSHSLSLTDQLVRLLS